MESTKILEVQHLKQHFAIHNRLTVKAVDDISFSVNRGEIFGLVGESGCGKSTLARCLAGIYRPTEGTVLYENVPVSGKGARKEQQKKRQKEVQIIFQDSSAALNPRMTVEQIVWEPVKIQKSELRRTFLPPAVDTPLQDKSLGGPFGISEGRTPFRRTFTAKERRNRLEEALLQVGLPLSVISRYPGELSGGQRQRVAIARSLMLDPQVVIADEPIASLDLSIQAQILTLFRQLQREKNFTFFFIAHQLPAVRYLSHRVGVMRKGKLVELAPTEELFSNPLHPYTKSLLSAIHIPDPLRERQRKLMDYDPATPLEGKLTEQEKGHFVLMS